MKSSVLRSLIALASQSENRTIYIVVNASVFNPTELSPVLYIYNIHAILTTVNTSLSHWKDQLCYATIKISGIFHLYTKHMLSCHLRTHPCLLFYGEKFYIFIFDWPQMYIHVNRMSLQICSHGWMKV
jgi:hypothetical protein